MKQGSTTPAKGSLKTSGEVPVAEAEGPYKERHTMFWRNSLTIQASTLVLTTLAAPLCCYAANQGGRVQSGATPIAFSTVTLYSAGKAQGAPPAVLGNAQSDVRGAFNISFTQPSDPDTVLYLIADGGFLVSGGPGVKPQRGSIRLATVLGATPDAAGAVINERTTVASAYTMAQFLDGPNIGGTAPGPQNAAATLRNLVDITTGDVGSVLGSAPNGLETSTMSEFNSLANLLASCVDATTPAPCQSLFHLTAPPGGRPPQDTLQAAVDIAHYPGQNALMLFENSQSLALYGPALASAPDAWTLALTYEGNGHEFDGPGNMAVDKDGNVWSSNNYVYGANPVESVCGGTQVIKLTPVGLDASGAPYSGGGLYGVGWGITLDPRGDLWVGNFGFVGQGAMDCAGAENIVSVSQFSGNGRALSPPAGWRKGSIQQPQGTVSDQQGNIWITNCGSNSVTLYLNGNPFTFRHFPLDPGGKPLLAQPFGMAIDATGNAWITSNGNDSVVGLAPNGTLLPGSPFSGGGIKAPLGIATDGSGNVWVSNSGVIPLEAVCAPGALQLNPGKPSVTEIRADGQAINFTGGGITIPWGIAADGNDNIWVANFQGQRLSEFCGARPETCPPGFHTGDPITPNTGYSSDALVRNTGVVIDPSGNVWLANNWRNVPVQTNPGGHALVVFIGLAAPIKTPLIGPPQQP